ncbi:hypothetical protein A3D00_05600 [Candidatus Woesebacteria bacterium RIFCSPHIGHO2_02_FULL_38_9]|nr:MAG: hypothetical protein A3D00_05600 [Candidatus Woesebacteria bacterium RIFCSPHIGHO2_02_FULL_38_9]OGM57136.1 MAG: hypothetical protein A3A50_00390 [Candidatus Woesebacteria bacterium RIFCSPLOWO2_01_FULL_38_20]
MRIIEHLAHFFIPRHTNNHRAKLLHSSTLIYLIVILIYYQLTIQFIARSGFKVLGYAANISTNDVARLINEERKKVGLMPLTINESLQKAAYQKGEDMVTKGYWAHVAPDGTEPWKFFKDVGYRYQFAGENLARDFPDAASAIKAWMDSPNHKDNILSSKYKETGVAVVEGRIAGLDTTVIVEFFGKKFADIAPLIPVASAKTTGEAVLSQENSSPVKTNIVVSPFNITRNLSMALITVILGTLVVDGIIVSRRKIVRVAGRTIAHAAFLGMILIFALIIRSGSIL